jgi:hypothetical protein
MSPRNAVNSAGHVRTSVALDLDELEDEDARELFVLRLGGREYRMLDPHAADYRDLTPVLTALNRGDVQAGLSGLLSPDDVEAFWENRIPAFKLEALIRGWLDHYGLPAGERR